VGRLGRDTGFGWKGIPRISLGFCGSRKAIYAVSSLRGLLSAEHEASADFRANFAAASGLTEEESGCPDF